MPTATGRETAQEKRERQAQQRRDARRSIAESLRDDELIALDVAAFEASGKPAYMRGDVQVMAHDFSYPAGQRHTVGRIEIDEGEARVLLLADALDVDHTYMSFGIGSGEGPRYGVKQYRP